MTLKRLCTIYTWRERQRGHQCWHSLPDTEEGEVVLWKNQVFQLSRKQTRTTAAAAGKAFKGWKASVSFTSTVVPTFPPVVAAFYENSSSPTTGLLIILAFLVWCLEGALASLLGPPRLLRSPKTFLLSYLHVVDGCAEKKGRRRMLYGQMAPDTHFSWSHHEGKMSLKVYNKFPDSLDAPKQFRKIRCQNRQPNFFHKTAPSSI